MFYELHKLRQMLAWIQINAVIKLFKFVFLVQLYFGWFNPVLVPCQQLSNLLFLVFNYFSVLLILFDQSFGCPQNQSPSQFSGTVFRRPPFGMADRDFLGFESINI